MSAMNTGMRGAVTRRMSPEIGSVGKTAMSIRTGMAMARKSCGTNWLK